jgi:hypothetical protein
MYQLLVASASDESLLNVFKILNEYGIVKIHELPEELAPPAYPDTINPAFATQKVKN